ncbi:glutathione S-transferase family protein [Halomonas denitrificans]|uniref:glutathione S-transferase family protein n=1 Tax=Halomonas TaxID=2745 RepID=UPI001A8F7EB8|nr:MULTISPECIES: glutathione S-transferase family protein [Halomonas]MED5294843.1 glutathione S-transferase family protein [Pseudomonadota bacterium]MBN8412546.1 glutathione S-transferase family protein [Halomonas litopenaei]MBY5924834.1 glutathione S-transferase family protein [Halomonas sp. DP4Y7-2]MBY5929441.1 glutathione S-transferase family protein [Halomonas sp. DP8Y7-3]MBY5968784.1 glutathione S-transferase family protein [Halomonas denitrificans]
MNLYGDTRSGNCYKIKLLASLLDIRMVWIGIDILAGDTREEDFLGRNPNGKIPLLELDDGRFLAESNAILHYLAGGSDWLPQDRFEHAKVLQWQYFEQYSHEPYIAVARFISLYLGLPDERKAEYEAKKEGGYKALKVMERQLEATPYLVGDRPTIADISLYAYTHVAHEGGFSLSTFPGIRAWLERIQALPGYVSLGDEALPA